MTEGEGRPKRHHRQHLDKLVTAPGDEDGRRRQVARSIEVVDRTSESRIAMALLHWRAGDGQRWRELTRRHRHTSLSQRRSVPWQGSAAGPYGNRRAALEAAGAPRVSAPRGHATHDEEHAALGVTPPDTRMATSIYISPFPRPR